MPKSGRFLAMVSPPSEQWNKNWESAVLAGALLQMDRNFDHETGLISGHVGPEYSYQSNLRNQKVHITRASMEYALYLLESREERRAQIAVKILDRMEQLQEKDRGNEWYGLWSWYVEEPLSQMLSVDFNWADFNGALLLCMIFRHGSHLSPPVIEQMKRMLVRCCASIRKRNVSMGYTNIACMGTFVTLAGAEVLNDEDLHAYAVDRLKRFASFIDQTGGFVEYNSPTYAKVVVQNMTCMLMFVKNRQSLELARRIHERIWLHLAKHWHLPTKQIAAPMSRCYFNDLGPQIWIQKALNNELTFMDKKAISLDLPRENADVGILDYRCPGDLKQYFTSVGAPRLHREIFLLGSPSDNANVNPSLDVEGTTFLTPEFCIGSTNRSDFWVQRRPLMAYWGAPQHPVRCLQLRLLKDDYDFSSGLFYSVQNDGAVLGQVRFRSDGGDRHISLDPIRDQRFQLSRMTVQLSFDVWEEGWKLFAGEEEITSQSTPLPMGSALFVDAGTTQIAVRFFEPAFGSYESQMLFFKEGGRATIELRLMSSATPVTLDWRNIESAGCGIALLMKTGRLPDLLSSGEFQLERFKTGGDDEFSISSWQNTRGKLELTTARAVGTGDFMDRSFRSYIDGQPVPMQRLSSARLV